MYIPAVGNVADGRAPRESAVQRASGLLALMFSGFWQMAKSDQEIGSSKGMSQRGVCGVPIIPRGNGPDSLRST
jgi:hypothetical protein